MSNDKGNEMVIFYSLGNFVSTQQQLSELLGGMGKFTIEKSVLNGESTVRILNPEIDPLVMHYNSETGEFGPYMLSDYTDELAAEHGVHNYIEESFTVESLKETYNKIMSMNVTPSTGTNLLEVSFDWDGSMLDKNGNYVEDTESITADQYYGALYEAQQAEEENSPEDYSGEDTEEEY